MTDEVPNTYSYPTTQELSALARKIQHDDEEYVTTQILRNPRLLATTNEKPTILQEGFRYNALHVAAYHNRPKMTQIILATVSSPLFIQKLYPDAPVYMQDSCTKYLTDLYLNMPDKGSAETPLHFACKFNNFDVIKLLIGHPLCDLTLRNVDGLIPEDIIGKRAPPDREMRTDDIRELFRNNRIVPIWREISNDCAPIVGRPVNPKYLGEYSALPFLKDYGDISVNLFGPVDVSCIPKCSFGTRREIMAYAGPTNEELAGLFYNAMKGTASVSTDSPIPVAARNSTDCNSEQFNESQPSSPSRILVKTISSTPSRICVTPERRVPSNPRTPVTPKSRFSSGSVFTPPREYTPNCLAALLKNGESANVSPNFIEHRGIRLKDIEKGVERVARQYAMDMGLPWNEYWKFLDKFVDIASDDGLVMLEDHLFQVLEGLEASISQLKPEPLSPSLSELCCAMSKLSMSIPIEIDEGIGSGDARTENTDFRTHVPMLWDSSTSEVIDKPCTTGPHPETNRFQLNPFRQKQLMTPIRKLHEIDLKKPNVQFRALKNCDSSDGNTSDDEKSTGWKTPASSFTSDAEFEDCDTFSLYIHGSKESKEDYQVFHAISHVIDTLSYEKYPLIIGWANSLKSKPNTMH